MLVEGQQFLEFPVTNYGLGEGCVEIMQIVSCSQLMTNLFIKNGTLFFGFESLSKGYNVLNEFMFQSHMGFCCMQWLPTRFYGSLSVYSRPLPSEKIAPLQPS